MKPLFSASAALMAAGLLASPAAFAQMAPSSQTSQPAWSGSTTGTNDAMAPWQERNQPALSGSMTSGSMTEAYTAVTPRQEHLGLPSGPYLLSCTNAHMSGGTLVATCDNQASASEHTMDRWRLAELPNAGQCNGAIENFNGRLVCGTEPMVGSSTPPQSYGSAFGGSAETPPYEGEGYGSNSAYPAGYPHGQPVAPAVKPLVGSSMAPQSYDSSSGTSTHIGQPYPGYGTWRTPTYQPMPQAYPSGYPQGQPVAPAAKPYYSQPY